MNPLRLIAVWTAAFILSFFLLGAETKAASGEPMTLPTTADTVLPPLNSADSELPLPPFWLFDGQAAPAESFTRVDFIDVHGNLHLAVSPQELYDLGFQAGDMLYVSLGFNFILEMPLVTLETDVDLGEDMLLDMNGYLTVQLRGGSIADAYDIEADSTVHIFLAEKQGYFSEYMERRGLYSLETAPDYSDEQFWVYHEDEGDKAADVFMIGPTLDFGEAGNYNMSLEDRSHLISYLGEMQREKGLFEESCNLYAPYYRQATLEVFALDEEAQQPFLDFAYEDVKAAFTHYLETHNQGKPIILMGFSQGGYMCTRLIEDFFADEALRDQLVAVYAIGWCITQEDADACPWLQMAQSEDDLGVVISFECEAPGNTGSFSVAEGETMLSINPLTWSTDTGYAARSLNQGSVFMDSMGRAVSRFTQLTGAYIHPTRGTLVCTDIDPRYFTADIPYFESGEYHAYDYELFYENLRENVDLRLSVYLGEERADEAMTRHLRSCLIGTAGILVFFAAALALEQRRKRRLQLLE